MYWPLGTPRVYASHGNRTLVDNVVPHGAPQNPTYPQSPSAPAHEAELLDADGTAPNTPSSPCPPAIRPLDADHTDGYPQQQAAAADTVEPLVGEPVLALRVSRNGTVFGSITAITITLWQTKV